MTELLILMAHMAITILGWEASKKFASVLYDWHQDRKLKRMGINWAGKDAPIWDAKHPEPLSTDQIMDDLGIPSFLRRQAE